MPIYLGAGAQHRREARSLPGTIPRVGGGITRVIMSYTVQQGDADTDGIYIPANPLGDNAHEEFQNIARYLVPGGITGIVPTDMLLPANQLGVNQGVDGSSTRECEELLCTGLTWTFNDGSVVVFGHHLLRYLTYGPYRPQGTPLSLAFDYDGYVYLFEYLRFWASPTDSTDNTFVYRQVYPLRDRAGFRMRVLVDGTRLLRSEARGFHPALGFRWDNIELSLTEGQSIDVKLIETATASFGEATYTRTEGDTFDVTVNLDEAFVETTVTVPVTVTPNGGATEADYSGIPENLVFAPGEASKTFTVTVFDDTEDDDDESITLSFGEENHNRAGVDNQSATITLTDNDDPAVTVQFGQESQGVGEGESVNVTISLSADPERTVTIPIVATPQGTASAADYSVPTSVTFNAGDTEKTIAFMATPDDDDDDDETVKLSFGSTLPPRVSEGTRTETTLNIGDDDDPTVTVTFGQATYTVAEGGMQQVTVTSERGPGAHDNHPHHGHAPGHGKRCRLRRRAARRHLHRRDLPDLHLHCKAGPH